MGVEQSTLVVYFPYRCTLLGQIHTVATRRSNDNTTSRSHALSVSFGVDDRCLFHITAVVLFDVRVRDARLTFA